MDANLSGLSLSRHNPSPLHLLFDSIVPTGWGGFMRRAMGSGQRGGI
jgi:hypothetical protein